MSAPAPEADQRTPVGVPDETPLELRVAMFGGERAGKTSLLASMYRSARGEARRVGLSLSRKDEETMTLLDAAATALGELPRAVVEDPTLTAGSGVATTSPGAVRRFDFLLSGAGVDVATLSFYDFSGEDIRQHASTVVDGLREANILFVAINTPAMMEAHANPDYDALHLDANLPDHLDHLLRSWTGPPPMLVLLSPIKCERWMHDEEGIEQLHAAVTEMYAQTLSLLRRDKFVGTTVVLAPVETVGSVQYRGLQTYDPALPPSAGNVLYEFELRTDGAGTWAPRFHEQPFRWALMAVARLVDYSAIVDGAGSSTTQRVLGSVGRWWRDRGYIEVESVREFMDRHTGLAAFHEAFTQLAEGRILDRPFALLEKGDLVKPLDP